MKCLMILTVGFCLLFTAVPAVADQAADEAAIREASKQMFAAWNAHDATAASSLLDADCEYWTSGKCLATYENGFPERYKNVRWKVSEDMGIFFITPDVAAHKLAFEYSGYLDTDGKPAPPGKMLRVWVYVKKDGKWLQKMQLSRAAEQ